MAIQKDNHTSKAYNSTNCRGEMTMILGLKKNEVKHLLLPLRYHCAFAQTKPVVASLSHRQNLLSLSLRFRADKTCCCLDAPMNATSLNGNYPKVRVKNLKNLENIKNTFYFCKSVI
ncbi:hypothetical protein [Lysinibacillus xylanilyticus]|uniref:hypothetical protein n=1 Tax=Lysinibacillus xylanilyticus TaxID=582475 RepID=UPI00381E4470